MIKRVRKYSSTYAKKQGCNWTKTPVRTCTKLSGNNQGGKLTILWNKQVQTEGAIPSNKPDIIIRDNEKITCMLIDVAIPGDRNVIKKEAEKILKHKDLTI